MEVSISIKTSTSSESEQISAALSGSFSRMGMKLKASASFFNDIERVKSNSETHIRVKHNGQDKGTGMTSYDIDGATDDLINLHNIAKTGRGLYLVLQRYETHPDFIAIVNALEEPGAIIDDIVEETLYDGLVRLRVIHEWYMKQNN